MTWVYLPKSVCSQDMVGSPLVSNLPRSPARPSAMSSGTSSASNSSSSASSMGSLTMHQSGMTLQHSTGDLGVDRWILSLQGSRASLIHTQENVLGKKIAGTSGQTPYGSYGKWDPDTSSWRMSEDWLTGLSRSQRKSLGVFPRQGMMLSGVCIPLPKRELHTRGKGGGVSDTRWMTPNVMDSLAAKSQEALNHEHDTARPGRRNPNNLRDQVAVEEGMRMWPTPQASDSHPAVLNRNHQARMDGPKQTQLPDVVGGQLNPTWVEWLMGLPIGWTDLKPLAMESYRLWWQSFLGT